MKVPPGIANSPSITDRQVARSSNHQSPIANHEANANRKSPIKNQKSSPSPSRYLSSTTSASMTSPSAGRELPPVAPPAPGDGPAPAPAPGLPAAAPGWL